MKYVNQLMAVVLMVLCSCGESLDIQEQRLVFDPFDARIDGICYLLSADARTAVVTAGDVFYRDDVTIPETVVYEGVTYRVVAIAPKPSLVARISVPCVSRTVSSILARARS